MDNVIERAIDLANRAHAGQKRKYNGLPYIVHPAAVATAAMKRGMREEAVAAAWLHDVFEDAPAPFVYELRNGAFLGTDTLKLVDQLTNASIGSKLPRAERKAMDRTKLAAASNEAKIIKMLDRLDNLESMSRDLTAGIINDKDRKFFDLYSQETLGLLEVVADADGRLAHDLHLAAMNLRFLTVKGGTNAAP